VAAEPDEFARSTWSRAPLLSTRSQLGSTDGFDDLFSLDAVDELLSRRGLRTPFVRLAKGGTVVPPGRYTRSGGTGAQVGDQVADDRVLELFLDGHTIVLQGLHRMWPPLIDFASALTADLGHPVQVNAYITPSSSQGFSAHYDVHDVFVLQVAGEKRWRVHEPVLRDPLRDQPWTDLRAQVEARAAEDPVIDTVLRPGDALYLPRGYLHAAEALGGVTCHLTVGVHPVTRHAVLESLLALVGDARALRTSLPLGVDLADPAAVEPELQETVAALTDRLRQVTAAEVSERLAARLVTSNRPSPVGPLAQAAAADAVSADTVLAVRPFQRHVLTTEGDEVLLRLFDRTVRMPLPSAKAVRALLDGEALRVADLPDLDLEDALALARRLLREAVVVADPAP
jgi:hypothetical protein